MRFLVTVGLALAASAAHGQIYRCGNSYSETPCAGGQTVDATPQGSRRQGAQGPTTTVYLCQSYGGGMFWSSAHCNTQGALIERMETVPSSLPWDQKVAIAESQRAAAQRLTQPPPVVQQYLAPQAGVSQCAALGNQIASYDAMARQPQTGQMQDWISQQRKLVRDQQFRLRC